MFRARSRAVRTTPNKHLRKALLAAQLVVLCACAGNARIAHHVPLAARCSDSVRLIVLGDSLGYGYGASNRRYGITGRIAAHLRDRFARVTLQNLSIPGADAAHIARAEVPALRASQCDAIVVIAGANDVQEYRLPGRFSTDFTKLLDRARAADPRAAMLVIGLPDVALSPRIPVPAKPFIAYLSRADNDAMQRAADAHRAAFVPLYALSERTTAAGWQLLSADNLHPNDFGYAMMASAAIPVLDREIARRAPK